MRPYVLKIPAGAEIDEFFGFAADYVRVHSSAVALVIKSPDNGEEVELQQGDDSRLTAFERLRFSHADASEQTVTIYIGRGTQASSARIGGSVQPVGGSDNTATPPDVLIKGTLPAFASTPAVTIAGNLPSFATSQTIQAIADPLEPQTLASKYVANPSAVGLTTVVTPAANVSGIRVDMLGISDAGGSQAWMAKSSAPTSANDSGAHCLLKSSQATYRDRPVIIPAGLGLYYYTSVSTGHSIAASYEVL